MARDQQKNTIGNRVESVFQDVIEFTGVGAGSIPGIYAITSLESLSPEGIALTAGSLASLAGGVYAGRKAANKVEGKIEDAVDNLKPDSMRPGELYLNSVDPFELFPDNSDVNSLDREKRQRITQDTSRESLDEVSLAEFSQQEIESEQAEPWIEDIAFGDITGLKGEYRTSYKFCGAFKTGYIDREKEVFVQAPRKGETFEQALENVYTWKENKQTLDEAEKYIDQVLDKTGTKTISNGENLGQTVIDYDFLRENEEILREETEDGILTPSQNYDIIITSHRDEPIPVLVGEYNPDMLETQKQIDEEKRPEIEKRKQVLGMYMDTLIEEGVFEGVPGDFWYQETVEDGRTETKNMFYNPEKDRLGLTDIGEYRNGTKTIQDLPQVDVKQPYALEKA